MTIIDEPVAPTGKVPLIPPDGQTGGEGEQGRSTRERLARLSPFAPLLAGGGATLAVLYQLLGGGVLGLADNADGARLACQLGVDGRVPAGGTRYFGYVITTWDKSAPAAATCPKWGQVRYPSSETPLLRAAEWLSHVLGFGGTIDLRALGILCALIFGVAIGLLTRWAPGPLKVRLALAVGVTVVAGDPTFSSYFISMYSEPAGFLALLLLCVAWLWVPGRAAMRGLSAAFITLAGAVLVVDKSQTAPLVFVVMAGLIWRRSNLPARSARIAIKGLALGCCGLLMVTFVGYEQLQPKDTGVFNNYNSVFYTLLGHTNDPAADLKWLGLPTELARYAGTTYWSPNSAVNTGDPYYYHQFLHWHLSYLTLFELYVTHPVQAMDLFHRMTYDAAELRPGDIGTSAYHPGAKGDAQTCQWCLLSTTVPAIRAWAWFLLPGFWLWGIWTGLALARRRRYDPRWRALGEVVVLLGALSIVSFGAVLLGEGDPDAVKQMATADLSTALLLPFGLAATWGLAELRRRPDGTWRPGRLAALLGRFLTAPPIDMVPPEPREITKENETCPPTF